MTKLEILKETVRYYAKDTSRRALNEHDRCEYVTEDNKNCAVGRCLRPKWGKSIKNFEKLLIKFDLNQDICLYQISNQLGNLDKVLAPKYKGHNIEFWQDIRNLHDVHDNWLDKCGITAEGLECIQKIEKKIKNENYPNYA
jgi:hypothetical protein